MYQKKREESSMAKLHFYYSAMNAGKSTILLQSSYNYNERGMDTLLLVPGVDDRFGVGRITSRIGLTQEALPIDDKFDIYKYAATQVDENPNIKCVLVDEAQFLTKQQVSYLSDITDELNMPVLAYGLRSDFMGEPFEGSMYLMAWADNLIEIKTICHCGKKATMNIRIDDNGDKVIDGNQVEIGGNDRYIAVCRKHYKEGKIR